MRRLLAWLATRFPVQCVVTLEDYARIDERFQHLENDLRALSDHLASLSAQVKVLNSAGGFVSPKGGLRLER
jgi:hypothetical protein